MRFFFSFSKILANKKMIPLFLLVGVALVFMFFSILVFSELYKHQKKIMTAAEEDALWASYQLDRELVNFKDALTILEENYTNSNLEETQLSFEILYSRINVLRTGKLKSLLGRSPNALDILDDIKNTLDEMDGFVFSGDDRINYEYLLNENERLIKKTEVFILNTLGFRSKEKELNREESIDLLFHLGSLIGLLTVSVMFIIFLLFNQLKMVKKSYLKSKDLTVELKEAVLSAKNALKAKSEFIATMSHEIRTPMNSIIGFSHLLLSGDIEEKNREKVNRIQRSANSLLAIVNGILDFSKVDSGLMKLEKEPYKIDDILEHVYQTHFNSAKQKGLKFTISRDFSINDTLIGDKTRIQQILINIIGNAIKFTHTGSVDVSIYLKNKKELIISVKDTGIGISDGVNVFDIFQQADSSTTRLYGGTGLGLSITKKLVDAMDGGINYESSHDDGTLFIVSLPYTPDISQSSSSDNIAVLENDLRTIDYVNAFSSYSVSLINKEEVMDVRLPLLVNSLCINEENIFSTPTLEYMKKNAVFYGDSSLISEEMLFTGLVTPKNIAIESHGRLESVIDSSGDGAFKNDEFLKGKRILLAEDNTTNANIVKAIVEKIGGVVDWVENGKQAYERVTSQSYDLIIMDIRMPIMDGYEASKKICETMLGEKPPILVLTADVLNVEEDKTDDCFDEILYKPLDPFLLIEKVKKLVVHSSPKSFSENEMRLVKNDLEKLEEMLAEGSSSADVLVKKIIESNSKCNHIHILKEALNDITNYDYRDALLRVENYKSYIVSFEKKDT